MIAALALRYGERTEGQGPAPISADPLIAARRPEDRDTTCGRSSSVQENMLRGGLPGRTAQGRRMHTREVARIDSNVGMNKALWRICDTVAP